LPKHYGLMPQQTLVDVRERALKNRSNSANGSFFTWSFLLHHKQNQIYQNERRIIHPCIPYMIFHGGTSKGSNSLDKDRLSVPASHDTLLLSVSGFPDLRQIAGITDPHPLTSKAVVVSQSKRPSRDVESIPAQATANTLKVDVPPSSCNILADLAPSAVECGLLKAERLVTRFRMPTINHKRIFPQIVEELA
jgi:2-methylaconitate cis-trans-isomerase PrpF